MEIREDANHHREIEAELQALGYEYAWQRKRWRVWRDGPDLHTEDRLAEEPSAPSPGKGGHHPGAATVGDFMAVARRSKAKPARPLHLKRSGPSSDVESAHRGAPPRQGPSASSSSSVAPPLARRTGFIDTGHLGRAVGEVCEQAGCVACPPPPARVPPVQGAMRQRILGSHTPPPLSPRGGHEATETGLAYAPVSQAHGHNHMVQCFACCTAA